MQILVGTTTSKPCIAVAAETANDNMFQITPSGSAVECVANDNVFRVCFADPDQGTASAKYIGEHKLATKVAIIYDSSTEYSSGPVSYTHLTLPTKRIVEISVVAVSLKKKRKTMKRKGGGVEK